MHSDVTVTRRYITVTSPLHALQSDVADDDELIKRMSIASDQRIYALALALEKGYSVDRIHVAPATPEPYK